MIHHDVSLKTLNLSISLIFRGKESKTGFKITPTTHNVSQHFLTPPSTAQHLLTAPNTLYYTTKFTVKPLLKNSNRNKLKADTLEAPVSIPGKLRGELIDF